MIEGSRFWTLGWRLRRARNGDATSSRGRIKFPTGCCFLGSLLCLCLGGATSFLLVGWLAHRSHGGGVGRTRRQVFRVGMGRSRLEETTDGGGGLLWKWSLFGDFRARIQNGNGQLRAPLIGSSVHGSQGLKGHLAGAHGAARGQCHIVPARLDVGVAHQSKENVGGNGRGFEHLGQQVDLFVFCPRGLARSVHVVVLTQWQGGARRGQQRSTVSDPCRCRQTNRALMPGPATG